MKISVITIVYNDLKNISKTIESVLNQRKTIDFEYIVIDGGSDDGTLDRIKKYGDELKVFSGPDSGIYDALNKGVKLSTGDLLIFMNSSDVFYSSGSLKTLYDNYDESRGFCLGRTLYMYPKNKIKGDNLYLRHSKLPEFCHQSLLYSKKLHAKFGLYNQNFLSAADYDFFHKIYRTNSKHIKLDAITSIRLKTGEDSSESLLNTIEMIRIDFYNKCLSNSFSYRLKDLVAKAVKLSIKKVIG